MHRTSRHFTKMPLLRLLMVLLGVAVFAWGLHYKLSLYNQTERQVAQAPAAKLLSQQERPATGAQAVADREPPSVVIAFLLLLLASPIIRAMLRLPVRVPLLWTELDPAQLWRRPPPCPAFLA